MVFAILYINCYFFFQSVPNITILPNIMEPKVICIQIIERENFFLLSIINNIYNKNSSVQNWKKRLRFTYSLINFISCPKYPIFCIRKHFWLTTKVDVVINSREKRGMCGNGKHTTCTKQGACMKLLQNDRYQSTRRRLKT